MEMETRQVTLAMLAEGVAGEKFDHTLALVLGNVKDPNTDATAKRKLTLEFTIIPHTDRETIMVDVIAKYSIAPVKKSTLPMLLTTGANGKPEALAYQAKKGEDPRQSTIPFPQKAGNE